MSKSKDEFVPPQFEKSRLKPIGWDTPGVPAVYLEQWCDGRWRAVVEGADISVMLAEGDDYEEIRLNAYKWLNEMIKDWKSSYKKPE